MDGVDGENFKSKEGENVHVFEKHCESESFPLISNLSGCVCDNLMGLEGKTPECVPNWKF